MSEMMERVAKAIEKSMFAAHELPLPAELHEKYLATARAAIAAMREPTPEIMERMEENLIAQYRESDWEEAKDVAEGLKLDWIWMRGIDAILTSTLDGEK